MGRGSTEQRDMSKQQLATDNTRIDQAAADREAGRQKLIPAATNLMNSEGYSGDEKAAISGAALDPINSGYDAASTEINNRAARTRNDAGTEAGIAQVARDRTKSLSDTSRGLVQGFADEKQRRQAQGNQMMANMYGIDTNLVGGMAGLPQGDLANNAKGIAPGFGDYLSNAISGGATVAGGYLAGR